MLNILRNVIVTSYTLGWVNCVNLFGFICQVTTLDQCALISNTVYTVHINIKSYPTSVLQNIAMAEGDTMSYPPSISYLQYPLKTHGTISYCLI